MDRSYFDLLRSSMGYKTGLKPFIKPFSLVFIVTQNCNLNCAMCPLDRTIRIRNELNLQEIEDVFSSKVLSGLINLSITGGEPFLRNDITEIAMAAANNIPALKDLRFATNGTLTNKIVSSVSEILETTDLHVSVKVSLDGIESTHEKIRGIPGIFSKATSTLRGLEKLREKGYDLSLSIGFTAFDENIGEIWELYDKFGDEFEFFFKSAQVLKYQVDNPKQFGQLTGRSINALPISEQTRKALIKFTTFFLEKEFNDKASLWQSSRKMYYRYMLDFLKTPDIRPVPCSACFSFFDIDSDGSVYACSVSGLKLGNVRETPLDEIWYSPTAFELRKVIKRGDCTCCTSCDLGPSIAISKWHKIVSDYILTALGIRK